MLQLIKTPRSAARCDQSFDLWLCRDTKTGDAPRHWRWRGFITDYYTAEAPLSDSQVTNSDVVTAQQQQQQQQLVSQPNGNSLHQQLQQQDASSQAPSAQQVPIGSDSWQASDSAAEGSQPASDAPAFLLVHGFGAFGEQWRGQIKALTAAGYQVLP